MPDRPLVIISVPQSSSARLARFDLPRIGTVYKSLAKTRDAGLHKILIFLLFLEFAF